MELVTLIIFILAILYSPAIIMLIVAVNKLKSNPKLSKKLFIGAGIYILIGLGICGALTSGYL